MRKIIISFSILIILILLIDEIQSINEGVMFAQSGSASYTGNQSTPLWAKNLYGNGINVQVSDTGLDFYSCFFYDNGALNFAQTDPYTGRPKYEDLSETHRKIVQYVGYGDSKEDGDDLDGTHSCGIVAGDPENPSYDEYIGVAPQSRLAMYDLNGNPDASEVEPPFNLSHIYNAAHDIGIVIGCHPWNSFSYYSTDPLKDEVTYRNQAYETDKWLWEHQDSILLFMGITYSPALCKNVIRVGGHDLVGTYDNSLADGPTADGQIAPHLIAFSDETYSAESDKSEVSEHCDAVGLGGLGRSTSFVCGLAPLILEYYQKGFFPSGVEDSSSAFNPMGALIRGTLIHGAIKTPSQSWNQYGFGRPCGKCALKFVEDSFNLFVIGNYDISESCSPSSEFDTVCPRILNEGDYRKISLSITDDSIPLVITLSYYDLPGAVDCNPCLIHDLDLIVSNSTHVFPVNNLASGVMDNRNTIEKIEVLNIAIGEYTIQINATSLTEPQPFSLIVTGGFASSAELYPFLAPNLFSYGGSDGSIILLGHEFGEEGDDPTIDIDCDGETLQVLNYTYDGFTALVSLEEGALDPCGTVEVFVQSSNGLVSDTKQFDPAQLGYETVCQYLTLSPSLCDSLDLCTYDITQQTCWSTSAIRPPKPTAALEFEITIDGVKSVDFFPASMIPLSETIAEHLDGFDMDDVDVVSIEKIQNLNHKFTVRAVRDSATLASATGFENVNDQYIVLLGQINTAMLTGDFMESLDVNGETWGWYAGILSLELEASTLNSGDDDVPSTTTEFTGTTQEEAIGAAAGVGIFVLIVGSLILSYKLDLIKFDSLKNGENEDGTSKKKKEKPTWKPFTSMEIERRTLFSEHGIHPDNSFELTKLLSRSKKKGDEEKNYLNQEGHETQNPLIGYFSRMTEKVKQKKKSFVTTFNPLKSKQEETKDDSSNIQNENPFASHQISIPIHQQSPPPILPPKSAPMNKPLPPPRRPSNIPPSSSPQLPPTPPPKRPSNHPSPQSPPYQQQQQRRPSPNFTPPPVPNSSPSTSSQHYESQFKSPPPTLPPRRPSNKPPPPIPNNNNQRNPPQPTPPKRPPPFS